MAKPLPTRADLVDYNYAVAGHDGTLCDANGELFIKPCTAAEIAFYESSLVAHPDFAEFMPTFLGTLTLDEQTNGTTIEEAGAALLAKQINGVHSTNGGHDSKQSVTEVVVPVKTGKRIATNQAVVLQNAAHGFVKPNILDVKLGVRLWADDAHQDKKTRFNKVTEETTHKDLGFRIAGMRVWQGEDAVGKGIDAEGYRIYDKDYGRFSLHTKNVHEAFRKFMFTESAGIDEELGRLVSQAFLTDVRRIQEVLEVQESRMFSASFLFVFEGDGDALRMAMEEASKPPTALTNCNGIDSEGDEDEDEDTSPKIYTVKVIDFAHATWTPGMGPDENSLVGVRSVAKILEELAFSSA